MEAKRARRHRGVAGKAVGLLVALLAASGIDSVRQRR